MNQLPAEAVGSSESHAMHGLLRVELSLTSRTRRDLNPSENPRFSWKMSNPLLVVPLTDPEGFEPSTTRYLGLERSKLKFTDRSTLA